MFERIRRRAKEKVMDDERKEGMDERADDKMDEEVAEKLEKLDVDEVAGGAGKQSYDKPPELPEIM